MTRATDLANWQWPKLEGIDAAKTYRVQMPDGSMQEFSGSELIRTGEAFAAFAAAVKSVEDW